MKKLLGAAALALTLVACAHTAKEYKSAAKKAISSKQAAAAVGQSFTDITCNTPDATKVGTTFTCTATGKNDGKKYEFTATITSNTRVEITDYKAAA